MGEVTGFTVLRCRGGGPGIGGGGGGIRVTGLGRGGGGNGTPSRNITTLPTSRFTGGLLILLRFSNFLDSNFTEWL